MTQLARGTGLLSLALLAGVIANAQSAGHNTAKLSRDFGRVPLYFEENRGQTDARARFIARTGNLAAFLTQDGWTLSMHGEAISMRIADANRSARLVPEGTVEGISNYYLGSRVITGLPHYASLRVTDIRPGIDIVYHASERDLEYDFVIRPGADPNALRLRFEGGKPPILAGNGDLLFKTISGELRQRKPRVWQEVEGQRKEVECSYALLGASEVRLVLENYDHAAELVIDPVLAYSTYLGGTNQDVATGIAVDASGNAYVAGYTASTDFPVTTGSFRGYYDAFVTKLNASGSGLIYSTFIGGTNQDQANGLAVDNAGNAYVTGVTTSSDFPFTINHLLGFQDAFVAKLGSTGAIVYCTAVGGNNQDSGAAIAVDAQGAAYIAGFTNSSSSLATGGSYKTTLSGNSDAFVAKLLPSGQISYATYLGGASDDNATAIALDSSGNAHIGGTTSSANFPASFGAYATALAGGQDAFVAKLNSTGSALIYATYLGGSSADSVSGLAVDASGNAYVSGTTQSSDFPTTMGAFATSKPVQGGATSGFVAKLNAMGGALIFSTFLGGNGNDATAAIAIDINGFAYVAGNTQSSNFPTTPGALRIRSASNYYYDTDMFFVKVDVDGSALIYSTLLGSSSTTENANALALDGNGAIYLAGYTSGLTYPTTSGAFQASSPKPPPQYSSPTTAVVSKIDMSSTALCNPSFSPPSQSLPGRGGAISFNLTLSPGCPWEAVADSFITLSAPTHGVISVQPIGLSGTVPLNDSTSSGRVGTVRVGPATFTVNQDAGSCQDPVISPLSVMFDSSGGLHDMILTLPSVCPWVALSNAPWLIVTANPSGNGSATITIFAGQNNFSTRTATLTLAGKPIMVTQTGSTCTAMASATPMSFSAQGNTGLVRITTNSSACQWTAYSFVPWIQLAAMSNIGQGSGSVPFVVASNPGSLPRSGQILIADQTLTIMQSAGPAGTVSGFSLSTFAGGGYYTLANRGDGGPALGALLSSPYGLAFDPATGNMYIAEYGASRIRVVTPDGNINTFAGGGSGTGENILATSAALSSTYYVAVDSSSSVYIDDFSTRIRKISQGNIATFAGTTMHGFSGDNGAATAALLSYPAGLAADTGGNIYIADASNNRVRKVNGGTITTFAGGGNGGLGDNGPATSATLLSPQGLAVDAAGNLYIADNGDSRVRKVSQGTISTFAGGGNGGDGGPATSALVSNPTGLAVDPLGDVFLAESSSSGRVRMVGLDGKISTVAGSGAYGFSPLGLAADTSGNVYFSDSYSGLVRKLTPISFCTYTVATPPTQPPAGGTLQISVTTAAGCNWTAASDLSWLMVSSGSPGMGSGTVNFTVSSNSSSSPRTGTIVVAGQVIQVTQAAQPPSAVSVTPSSGSGSSQTFSFLFSDPNGYAQLSTTYMLINSVLNWPNSCYTFYDRNANKLSLLSDSGTYFVGSVTPGQSVTLQNSQCSLSGAGSSVTPSGNNLTINVALTFTAAFGGAKNIYMNAQDSGGLWSNWQQLGTWTVSVAGNQPPTNVSVTPSSGSGSSQTFRFVFSNPYGFADLSTTYMLINSVLNWPNACYTIYDRNANKLSLLSDSGTYFVGSVTPGQSANLQNSQCTLSGAGSSVSGLGNNLTINVALTFQPAFGGAKNIYLNAQDSDGLWSNWQALGTWMAPAGGNQPPTNVSVTPSSGSGSSQTFSFVFSDSDGFADLSTTYMLVNSVLNWPNACYTFYDRNANKLSLLSDSGTYFVGSVTPGQSATLQNSQCTLSGTGSSVSGVGNNLTVNVALTFKAAFGGAKNVYLNAQDSVGLWSNWQALGTWTPQ